MEIHGSLTWSVPSPIAARRPVSPSPDLLVSAVRSISRREACIVRRDRYPADAGFHIEGMVFH